jgi:hypothetical protein
VQEEGKSSEIFQNSSCDYGKNYIPDFGGIRMVIYFGEF